MKFLGYYFTIAPLEPAREILIAELGELPFDSFIETETGLEAYIRVEDAYDKMLSDVFILSSKAFTITHEVKEIEQVNWNSEWEKNFEPIHVDNQISVIAPFHEFTNMPYEIVIEPKMSFGTGHHATTHLMLKHLLELDINNKSVLDIGTGTGILAIFSEMRGAKPIDAIDIDEWCYINTKENCEKNNCQHITAYQGDASMLIDQRYDVVIANINRNILLNDMGTYHKTLNSNGVLLLSGFYTEDIATIEKSTEQLGFKTIKTYTKDNWVGLLLSK